MKVGLAVAGYKLALSPADITEMLPILMGMLGLGGSRTVEKINGVAGRQASHLLLTDPEKLDVNLAAFFMALKPISEAIQSSVANKISHNLGACGSREFLR